MQQRAATLLNERLNNSEMMLREKIGDEKLGGICQRGSARWRKPIRRCSASCIPNRIPTTG